jgi:3-oxoadipate enol-lactonase
VSGDFDAGGGGGQPTVVLLHGQPGGSSDWYRVIPILAPYTNLVATDRPGYGRRGGVAGGFRANAEAVIGLLDRMKVPRALMVGHSWGGGVALSLASEWPDRVAGLVLVASVSPGAGLSRADRLLAAGFVGPAASAAMFSAGSAALSLPVVRSRLAHLRLGHDDADVAAYAGRLRQRLLWSSFVIEQRALVSELAPLASELGRINAPTTVLAGTADRLVPLRTARLLAGQIPGAQLVELSGAGHLIPQRHPTLVATSVLRMIRSIR